MSDATLADLANVHRHPISVEVYHQMIDNGVLKEDDRVELIEGVIVAVSPQSPEHMYAISTLMRLLIRALGDDWVVRPQGPLTLARSEPEPDIVVVRKDIEEAAARHPSTASLVVEVAKTSLSLDRALAAIYGEAAVEEYWIIDVERQRVEVFRSPQPGGYASHTIANLGDMLEPVAIGGLSIRVADLFRRH